VSFEEYQTEVMRTCGTHQYWDTIAMASIGLAGETGECCDLVKKELFHNHLQNKEAMKKELGDALWYLTVLCDAYDLTLDEVVQANIEKLQKRYPSGFDAERSKNRATLGVE
jgi:NTP pyrophosphatase (non-canonical NTP hydrolase)